MTGDAREALIRKNAKLLQNARQLRAAVKRVTPEEFRWQEAHYDHDSQHGRELLFLVANHEWVRATSEIVDITRSDAIDTIIKIDIDLDQITHEAFRERTKRLWLPVIMLPPQAAPDGKDASGERRPEPDPFATVTDAAGDLLAILPQADVRHQTSAALAEIIVNIAVARWPGDEVKRPTATRDMRLVLSAAIYRVLRGGPAKPPAADRPDISIGALNPRAPRFENAKQQLGRLLDSYNLLLNVRSRSSESSSLAERDVPQFAPELVRRAAMILEALIESVMVVVPIDHESAPTVLTVRVPTRGLYSPRKWKAWPPSTWILRPLGHLQIDVLLPSADADRQIQVNLPDGVSLEESRAANEKATAEKKSPAHPGMVIKVEEPQSLKDLAVLMCELLNPKSRRPASLQQSLADLASAKADTAQETLRWYLVHRVDSDSAAKHVSDPGSASQAVTSEARATLRELRTGLDQILAGRSIDAAALAELQDAQTRFKQLMCELVSREAVTAEASTKLDELRAGLDEILAGRSIDAAALAELEDAQTRLEELMRGLNCYQVITARALTKVNKLRAGVDGLWAGWRAKLQQARDTFDRVTGELVNCEAATAEARAKLDELRAGFDEVLAGRSDAVTLTELQEARDRFDQLTGEKVSCEAATAEARAKLKVLTGWLAELQEAGDRFDQLTGEMVSCEAATAEARAKLDELRAGFNEVSAGRSDAVTLTELHEARDRFDQLTGELLSRQAATAEAYAKLDAELGELLPGWLPKLQGTWARFERLTREMLRRTSVDTPGPRSVVARANMIEDVSQRAVPKDAKIHIDVSVTDAEYFSIARFSGGMSLLLMTVVWVFFLVTHGFHVLNPKDGPSAEVLAIVLIIFSAIQAGRIERPDRTSLRGLLSAVGNWLTAASILPAVILAVGLAFSRTGLWPVIWPVICIVLQVLFQAAMWKGPLTASGPSRWFPGSRRRVQHRQFQTGRPDYQHSEALRSDWWRSTTADALMIGRKAHAYVIWQEGISPSLPQLLMRDQLASPRLAQEAALSAITPEASADDAATGGPPANILALLRSGTVGQAVTFVVFREKPSQSWVDAPPQAIGLDLDPDRLAPWESVSSTVDVFLGVRRDERIKAAEHPLSKILGAAAHRLIVLEAQLPVPVPVAGYTDMHWARIRVALRNDDDIKRLGPFLDAIHKSWAVANAGREAWAVAVQTVPVGGPRIISDPSTETSESAGEDQLVMSNDMDVVNAAADDHESAAAHTWRVLAICADARSNIETDIVQKLGQVREQLQLVGLTYALLHGTAVVLLLGHEPEALTADDVDLETALRSDLTLAKPDPALAKVRVLVNERRSRNDLGRAEEEPLLRVHFRSQDRPGALLDVLNSLSTTLSKELHLTKREELSVWHAQTQVIAGAGLTRLTVRLPPGSMNVDKWDQSTYEEIARKTVEEATAVLSSVSPSGDELHALVDPVISVSLIEAPPDVPQKAARTGTSWWERTSTIARGSHSRPAPLTRLTTKLRRLSRRFYSPGR